ncbi:MAG TPA: hypothetical protein DHW61_01490 [Lachnoclostridium phytofermentans]|uniref:Uncharacterized protein n=1 Tax=Lachnoclostridium phytofermentans TaxID=66219 RepID=A0A3D2X1S1_9FIRM|nr:DUF6709 family protein [Lachnoclostridium sp.]HCL01091.1 hypothetical protein [Lachnoclostridium phytofermentans]
MVEDLKYRYRNYNLKWIAISVVVAIAMLVASKFGIIAILKGPVELSGKWNPEELEGKYVTLDVDLVFGTFAEETSTNTKTNKTTTTSLCYLGGYFDEASEYGVIYGIKVSNANKDGLESIMDDLYNDTYPSKTHKITGTFKKMDGKILQYYNETLEEYFEVVPEDAIPYAIFDEEVNGMDITLVYILTAGAAIMFIVAIIGLIRLFAGSSDKYIKKFLDSNNKASLSQLELEFSKGKLIGKKIVAGRKYTFYQSGAYMHVVDHTEFVWAYYFSRSGKHSQSLVRTFNMNKKKLEINACKADAGALLQYYQESQPQMMVGYDKDLEKCFNKDFQTFLGYCYNDAKAKQETEDLFF